MKLSLCALALLLSSSLAMAEDARKIDFTAPILDQDSAPIVECSDPSGIPAADKSCKATKEWTLGLIALRSLQVPEQGLAAEESLRRGQLALTVYKSPSAALTAEDIALIKRQLAKAFGPLVVVRAFALLDPAAK